MGEGGGWWGNEKRFSGYTMLYGLSSSWRTPILLPTLTGLDQLIQSSLFLYILCKGFIAVWATF